jgi:hypothetical protein
MVRTLLALALSGGALWLALRQVSLADLRLALSQAEGGWVLVVLLSVAVNTLAKAWRWQVLCGQPGQSIAFGRYLGLLLAGQALNWLYPARLGDLLRVQGVGESGLGLSFALATLVTEKTLDTLAYALLLIGLLAVMPLPGWLNLSAWAFLLFAAVLVGGVALLVVLDGRWLPAAERLSAWLPATWRNGLLARWQRVVLSLTVLRSRRALLGLLGLTGLTWATALLNNWLAFQALRLTLPPLAAWLLLVALQAGISLPAMPGGIGIFEMTCVLVLGLWDVGQSAAFAYGVLLHSLVMLPVLLPGLFHLAHWGWRPHKGAG